ncbi:hypothetical protein V498_00865 [Pseudogymnoascus sp. VKM F-4517 (FW-2822)]|nr:hypothetical protein V498_00865 [Pseudogymnoascus sp. VKM F-4517 (FW-2822)]
MRSLLALSLTLLLADLSTADPVPDYWPYCDATPPLDPKCCSEVALSGRNSGRSLFRRTEICPSDGYTKPCCTKERPVITLTSDSLPLQCGSKYTDTKSDAIFTIGTCPTLPSDVYSGHSTQCLHIAPSLDESIVGKVTDTSLQISKDPLNADNTPNGLGTWNGNKYCNKISGVCDVPLDVITYGSSTCPGPVYLAYHVSTTVGGTCFARSDPPLTINPKGRWFLYIKLDFTCTKECVENCCCKKPVETKQCGAGTAFGYNIKCDPTGILPCDYYLRSICTANRWGWWHEIPSASLPYTSDLYVGAGQNKLTNGYIVGTATLEKCPSDSTKICVTYKITKSGYSIAQAHVDVQCTKPTESKPPGPKELPCAPGDYEPFHETCPKDGSMWTASYDLKCDTYYAIFHAAITRSAPISDTCTAVNCLTYSDPSSGP